MLKFVVANIRKQVLEAVLTDRTGRARKIVMNWKTREAQPVPPETWREMVEGEVSFQIQQEHRGGLLK